MTDINKLKQILDNAPDDDEITNVGHHKSVGTVYFTDWNYMGKYYFFDEEGILIEGEELGELIDKSYETVTNIQSLSDLLTIVELHDDNVNKDARIKKLEQELASKKQHFVGYTNGNQIAYAKEEEGSFYADTENNCYIPLYMLDVHLHRLDGTESEKWANELENEVLRDLLSARWSNRDRPMEMVISELIEMKRSK